ncbi:hypothetical protein OA174_07380 [Actinomycetota bacterium]|nr:hypothetical protein [Actinomycetota bacterium]
MAPPSLGRDPVVDAIVTSSVSVRAAPWDPCAVKVPGGSIGARPLARRRVLQGAIAAPVLGATAVALAACGSDEPPPEAIEVAPSPTVEKSEALLDDLALIGAYEGTLTIYPELRGSLAGIADQHRAHARELGATEEDITDLEPIPPKAANARQAITNLISRERRAAEQRAQTAEQSESAEQVRVFTFMAASKASHVPELRDIRSGVSRS